MSLLLLFNGPLDLPPPPPPPSIQPFGHGTGMVLAMTGGSATVTTIDGGGVSTVSGLGRGGRTSME